MLKRACMMALLSLCIVVSSAYAQAVSSSVTIDSVTVTPQMMAGIYKVEVKGKVTLGTNDAYGGFTSYYTTPTSGVIAPFVNLTPPAAGKTATYTSYATVTSAKGNWKANSALSFMRPGAIPAVSMVESPFTVP